jgi:hypothetical protein
MPEEQNYKNHVRRDPIFLSVLLVLLLNIILTINLAVHTWPRERILHLWLVILSVALFLIASKVRSYPLQSQNRIIRLEERLRYAALLPAAQLEVANALTLPQIIALRFASDSELPALVDRAAQEHLTPRQIKESIVEWRPDHTRV